MTQINHLSVLTEDFIRDNQDNIDWRQVCAYQNLSEDFIREFQDKVNWRVVSYAQQLSESFIREFKDCVNWNTILDHQTLSDEFCEEFNIESTILNSVFHCGQYNRTIYIKKSDPKTIFIGCFEGSRYKAMEEINKNYKGQDNVDYIAKVLECFTV